MDDFHLPLIACIHGTALGGGLETALACHWRIGAKSCKLGLPEVHLGILPGAGGTQRLTRIVGFRKAVEIITSGKMIDSSDALKLGIIDSVFDLSKTYTNTELIDAALAFAHSDIVKNTPISQRKISLKLAVPVLEEEYAKIISDVQKQSRGFVAPQTIVKAIRAASTSSSFEDGMKAEEDFFKELMNGPQAKALQYFFFAERRVGKVPGIQDDTIPKKISSVGVIGGGTMGAGITMNFIEAKIPVTLIETSPELAAAAVERIKQTYKLSSAYKKGVISAETVANNLSLIKTSHKYSSLTDADLVIEAAFENMPLKKQIFGELNKFCKPEAILATNTSYLNIDEIAECTNRAENVIGMREFCIVQILIFF